jgi:nicotinamide mononucleotide transporter
MYKFLRNYFSDWNLWDWSWTVIASVTAVWLGMRLGEGGWQTTLSVVTCLTGLWCVILVAKGRIFNYYLGIINVVGYAYIAYGYKLYGEVMLNAFYFLPMQFAGLIIWMRNKEGNTVDTVKTKFLTSEGRLAVGVVSVTATIVYGFALEKMGDPVPFLDSTSTVLSIVAMMLMAWRYMEQWILWIVVDVVSIVMWWFVVLEKGTNDIAMLVMWSAYLINAIYGFIAWIGMHKKQNV